MKKLNVIVKEKSLLELAEDGKKGDLIDLEELTQVDSSYLETLIASGKDKVYEDKLLEFKKRLDAENQIEIEKLNAKIEELKKEAQNSIKTREQELIASFKELDEKKKLEINDLKYQISSLKNEQEQALIIKEQTVKKESADEINELNKQIEILKIAKEAEIKNINNENSLKYNNLKALYDNLNNSLNDKLRNRELEITNQFKDEMNKSLLTYKENLMKKDAIIEQNKNSFNLELNKALQDQKAKFDEVIKEKENIINGLQRAKASMNVKQTGEDLEAWCDGEVNSYMQNGLFNCTWDKDNKVIKEEGETKGSKADYIFKVYVDEKHNSNELLASVCLDMKDENPDSVNKKTNADYYKQLDKNREKKECKYAVLVSNLELDKPNIAPIFKVKEYENMYVVRPAYMMTFLNMLASLTTRFRDLILAHDAKSLELQSKNELLKMFDDIKNTYLDKPLESLKKNVEDILKNSEAIKNAANKIDDQCDKIKRNYIAQIEEKINKFELKLDKKICKELE